MADPIEQLREQGQSVWLDYIRRGLITSGQLARMMAEGWISGVTSNPTIFERAIAGSHDYDDAIEAVSRRPGLSPYDAYLAICGEDIRLAADVLRPIYDATNGADGFVSFEAQAGGTEALIAEARRLLEVVGRPNVMIKIPGIPAGVAAVEQLIADGMNVNITLLFDVGVYEGFARAYIAGLERRRAQGLPLTNSSVASFFVSRIDTKVDQRLPEGSPLRGRVAIANARLAYKRFREVFSGPQWERLEAAGARLQRPLWGSTGTKNSAYSDVLYVEELVAPHTVNTMPEATLHAFRDHGHVRPRITEDLIEGAERVVSEAAAAGIDLKAVARECLEEGLATFDQDFNRLLEALATRLRQPRAAR
jgi:transaldolase